jgi:indole-3-glycerol phosphate synthase
MVVLVETQRLAAVFSDMKCCETIIDIENRNLKSSWNTFGEEMKDGETRGGSNAYGEVE